MGQKIVVCHYTEGGHWDAIEISTNGLNGHDGHAYDIWPPVPDVTPGHNWPQGEAVYMNGCVLEASPGPTPSPTSTLPDSGLLWAGDVLVIMLVAFLGILVGLGMVAWSDRKYRVETEEVPDDPDG